MDTILGDATDYVRQVCHQYQVDDTHGVQHALAVVNHLKNALLMDTQYNLDMNTQRDLLLTAILHDIDDHKYYPINANNALNFLNQRFDMTTTQKILTWISYIPTSQNGNQIPDEAIKQPWILWPRYCDRIEAVGHTGIARVIEYSHLRGVPDFVEKTPRPTTYDELVSYITPQRFEEYIKNNGVSASCIDHIYDKLLHICDVETYSPYINQCLVDGKQLLVDICLQYGQFRQIKFC
jgi:hypothetical protein